MRTAFALRRLKVAVLVLLGIAAAGPAAAAPSERAQGKLLFDRDCASCHQIGPGAMSLGNGPSLNGIIGMPAADEPGFSYSDANQRCGVIWSSKTFDAFIANPQGAMHGTSMAYAGLKLQADREALFAYVSGFDAHGATR
ncbi:cytochrome c family protein [Beijerinckia sp. L45]|uniref:c-type cytochrome n=1 Tax=Beijerinckia sp. L45 TaxID=1641855 RepID=UPI00131BF325|nr:c-type cytochrome [Beijerinckia sp. L45]